jgi:hypothetical protein
MTHTTLEQTMLDLAQQAAQGDSRAQAILDVLAQDELAQEQFPIAGQMKDNGEHTTWSTVSKGHIYNVVHCKRWKGADVADPVELGTVVVEHAPAVLRDVGHHATRNVGNTSAVRDTPVASMHHADKGPAAVRRTTGRIVASPSSAHRSDVVPSAVSVHDVQRGDVQTATMTVLSAQERPAVPFHADKLAAAAAARAKAADVAAFPWLFDASGRRTSLTGRTWRSNMAKCRARI